MPPPRPALPFLVLAFLSLAGGARDASAQLPGGGQTGIRRDLSDLPATVRAGLAGDPRRPELRLGLRVLPTAPPPSRVGADDPDPGTRLGFSAPSILARLRQRLTARGTPGARLDALLEARARRWTLPPADSARFLPPPPPPPVPTPETAASGDDLPRFVTDYADLALRVQSRMELGGEWVRYRPCDDQFQVSCNPSLVPQLTPDLRFGVQVAGSIADRVEVDVDFDQSREFDAANRINISYQGAENDILRRLDVGDVTFRLPDSRFLTEGIPAGNFGFQAEGQLGPLDFQTVWAQQRGDLNSREFRLTGFGDQRAFVQEDTLVLDDADYVRGQFFFLLDPEALDRWPHVDALDLTVGSAPGDVAPGAEPIQLYRYEDDPILRQQVEGFIQADAVAEGEGEILTESGWFRYLQPGVDYFVHPSGLWIALRSPLRQEEMLAVTYVTATGDTIGDYNPERIANTGGRPTLRLLKAPGANHQPGRPTWDFEMHQVYRVSGARDVEEGSVDLVVSLGERSAGRTFKRTPSGEDITFLRLLGLDQESPADELDPSFVYSPSDDLFAGEPPVQGTFVFFPTLEPFARPPPLPALGLDEEETARILGDDANRRIYEEEDPFERDNAGLFRLTLSYRIRSEGVISSFSLGALGIRDGSERVYLGDRLLVEGVDYEIDYDVGQVNLLQPEALFTSAPDATIRASWEQRALFQVSPTQVFGIRAHTDLGDRGGLDVLSLYQSERTLVTRPVLGTEPAAAVLGGLSGDVLTDVGWFDALLGRVPGLRTDGGTTLALSGEMAVSLPNPNTRDAVFVDDFDAAAEVPVSLLSEDWVLGSAPTRDEGAEGILPPLRDVQNAVGLVWQHQWIVESPVGDSLGIHEGFFPRQDIDRQIRVAGSEIREPGLLLSFEGSEAGGESGWRSLTTGLSSTGLDLTRTDFLEFYADGRQGLTLILDLGVVSEDAFFVDSAGNTSGVKPSNGVRWGLDRLDEEANPRLGEIWNTEADERGVWGESCLAEAGRIYRIGDPRAVCTRGNGRRDSEDLDLDGNLDQQERHLRYVVRLDGSSPYLSRTRDETGTEFQLYRIPLEGPLAAEVGGAFTDADLRAVKQLRITATGRRDQRVRVARMRLVGSRWVKRSGAGVLDGIGGDTLALGGRLEVGTVSRVTEGAEYQSPPGVLEELVDPTSAFAGQGIEFNEKSLGIQVEDLPPGARAEVYQRFPQRPRDFLNYRQARLWVVPRSGDFGPDRPHRFFFKVGSDVENFYLYRTPLGTPSSPAGVEPSDWLPEVVVDFEAWLELRRRAEEVLLLDPPGPGDPPVVVWSADSTYAVVLKDRGRAPDLANVRELSLGIVNEGDFPFRGEVWVDELRLGRPVRDAGVASSLGAVLSSGGVLDTRLTLTDRGALFRQLRDDPTYQDDQELSLSSTLRLDRWMPSQWGIDLPVTVSTERVGQDPLFLANSDLRADRLDELRPTESRRTRVGISFRKRTRTADPWIGLLVDGLAARMSYVSSRASTVTAVNDSDLLDAGLGWTREPEERDFALVPGPVRAVVRALLPRFLEDDVLDARLRWTPERVSVGTSYLRRDSRIFRYESIIRRPGDTAVVATLAPRETLEAAADLRFRPLRSLTADLAFQSVRDLLPPEEAVSDARVQALLRDQRTRLAGMELGWETDRSLRTRVGYRPRLVSWLQNDLGWTSVYRGNRNANFLERRVAGSDTLLALTRNARGQRSWDAAVAVDPGLLARALGLPAPSDSVPTGAFGSVARALQPVRVGYRDGLTARFNRDPVDPGAGFQLGWGGVGDFRFLGADTAATLVDEASWTASSGTRFPGGVSLDIGYQRSEAVTLDTRSDRTIRQERWPDLRVGLPPLVPPPSAGIARVSLSSGIQRSRREVVFGGLGQQRRDERELQIPLDVSITWIGGLVTSYRASFRDGEGRDPTGTTERDQTSHRISVSSTFQPPFGLRERLDRPVRLALLASYVEERDCRSTAFRPECVPFVDQLRRNLSLSLDTSVSGFEMGVQASFDQRQSFVGLRTGATQFQFGVFGQLQLAAGVLPVAAPF